jgi:hypothetical protein
MTSLSRDVHRGFISVSWTLSITLVEQLAPGAMDKVNADAFQEAYKDLVNMRAKITGQPAASTVLPHLRNPPGASAGAPPKGSPPGP